VCHLGVLSRLADAPPPRARPLAGDAICAAPARQWQGSAASGRGLGTRGSRGRSEMPIAEVNGQKLFYEDTGGDAPAVIFSHGLFMDHAMFDPQVAALKGRWRCIAWDERGHGGTAGTTLAPFSYYDSADDLAALLAHIGVKRAVLAGMSQGGFLSLRCA